MKKGKHVKLIPERQVSNEKIYKNCMYTAGIMFAIGAILAISGILAGAKSGIFIDWTSHGIRIVPQKDTYTYEAYDITDIMQ